MQIRAEISDANFLLLLFRCMKLTTFLQQKELTLLKFLNCSNVKKNWNESTFWMTWVEVWIYLLFFQIFNDSKFARMSCVVTCLLSLTSLFSLILKISDATFSFALEWNQILHLWLQRYFETKAFEWHYKNWDVLLDCMTGNWKYRTCM